MKKQLALGIAGASAALIAGWKLVRQLVDRGEETTDAVSVAPGVPAEWAEPEAKGPEPASSEPASSEPASSEPASSERAEPEETDGGSNAAFNAGSSKAELYEIAQELDIEGRSKMTKDELLKAIREAS